MEPPSKRRRDSFSMPAVFSQPATSVALAAPKAINSRLVAAGSAAALAAQIAANVQHFNDINCATALQRLSRFPASTWPSRDLLAPLAQRTVHVLSIGSAVNARTFTSILFGIVSLGLLENDEALMTELGRSGMLLLPEADGACASTILWALGSVAWGVAGSPSLIEAVCCRVAALAGSMRASEVASAAWGGARLRVVHPQMMAALSVAARRLAIRHAFTPQGICNVVWAWARLKLTDAALFSALADCAIKLLLADGEGAGAGFSAQDLATVAASFSRLEGGFPPRLAAALAAAVAARCDTLPSATVSALLNAFSSGGSVSSGSSPGCGAAVIAALGNRALSQLPEASAQDVGFTAAALARGAISVPAKPGAAAAVTIALAARCIDVAPAMHWRSVAAADLALRTLLCSAAAAEGAPGGPALAGNVAAADYLFAAAGDECVTLAALSDGCLTAGDGCVVRRAVAALSARAHQVAGELAAASDAAAASSARLLCSLHPLPWERALQALSSEASPPVLLLVGDDPGGEISRHVAVRPGAGAGSAASASARLQLLHWRRFACDRGGAFAAVDSLPAPSPTLPPLDDDGEPPAALVAAIVRFPASLDALTALAASLAPRMQPGAPLLLHGRVSEGLQTGPALSRALLPYFVAASQLAVQRVGGATVVRAERSAASPGKAMLLVQAERGKAAASLAAAAAAADAGSGSTYAEAYQVVPLQLPRVGGAAAGAGAGASAAAVTVAASPLSRPWRVCAGLFAGGQVDVMTAALLAALPGPPPPRARVLDWACGSGVIAAALLAAEPTLRMELLDADAAALAAARANVPSARRTHLCDLWPARRLRPGGRRRMHWIVANPPVHRGQADDLRPLCALLAGAPGRLRPGTGTLRLVAQAHVPVGALAAGCTGYASVHAMPVLGGRFVVWCLLAAEAVTEEGGSTA